MQKTEGVSVYVPATSANIGPGFDSVGLALSFGNRVWMEEAQGCQIECSDERPVPAGTDNLVYRCAQSLYQECGRSFSGLHIVQTSPIPMARGLGSSSACIVAGLLGANALLGSPCTRAQLLDMAAKLEGHPDNVAPAMLGGFVASALEEGRVYSVQKSVSETLCFAAFVPDFELSTERARAALPAQVEHRSAVYNLSRAVLCQAAFCEGRSDLFAVALQDRLHQPYRLPLIPGGETIMELAIEMGALGAFVSGAGPAILAVVKTESAEFWPRTKQALQNAINAKDQIGRFSLLRCEADNRGAYIEDAVFAAV